MKSETKKKSKKIIRAIFVILLLVIAAALVIAVARSKDELTLENVISNLTSLRSSEVMESEISYERSDMAVKLGNGIATVSENGIRTIDGRNNEVLLSSFTMGTPYLESNGDTALTCDIGGNVVKVFHLSSIVCEIETSDPIISSRLNDSGWFTVSTREKGYTSSVTVYNQKCEAVYKWYSGQGYILSARVADGNGAITALVLSEGGSELVWLKLNSEEIQSKFVLEDRAIIDFAFTDRGKVAAITADSLLFINEKANLTAQYDFTGYKLGCYDLQKKCAVLGLWEDKFGEKGKTVAVKDDGTETGSVETDGKIIDVSWAGKTCGVLLDRGVRIYTETVLKAAASFDDVGWTHIEAQKDGSVFITNEYAAKLLK